MRHARTFHWPRQLNSLATPGLDSLRCRSPTALGLLWAPCVGSVSVPFSGWSDPAEASKALRHGVSLAATGCSPYDWAAWGSQRRAHDVSEPSPPPDSHEPMNKADLVNLVAARTELTKTDVSMVVDAAIAQ